MKYPSKLYSIQESVVGKMTILMEMIPDDGIGVEDFFYKTQRHMALEDCTGGRIGDAVRYCQSEHIKEEIIY